MGGWGPRDATAGESWEDVGHLVFEKNDRDNDGVVTAAELSAALVHRYDRSADGEAARQVAALRILSVSLSPSKPFPLHPLSCTPPKRRHRRAWHLHLQGERLCGARDARVSTASARQ